MLISQQHKPAHVHLNGPASRALAGHSEWRLLCTAVRQGAAHSEVFERFTAVRSHLAVAGISEGLLNGIATGLHGGSWDDAVSAFTRSRGQQVNFYLGPIRTSDDGPSSMGLIILERRPHAAQTVAMLEQAANRIGTAMFGVPCSFMDRLVEFYDMTAAVGPFEEAGASSIALFTPFYFDGWSDVARQRENRRSLILHNIIRARFDLLTRPFLDGLRIDTRLSSLCDASDQQIDDAFTLWLTLHEMMHASGPMPLFAEPGHKLSLGMDYGPVEEMRTDMSAFVALGVLEGELGERARLAQELVLAERLLRSVRVGNALDPEANGIGKSLDGEHGCLWAAALHVSGALRVEAGQMHVDWEDAHAAVRVVLGDIYAGESAARNSLDAPQELSNQAAGLRRKVFTESGQGYALPVALERHYRTVTGPDRIVLTFQDC
ncbi:DUF6421 family protein [Streptomyces rishiriensis]|uniref:DUF6421 family protein n=1 Tax=Streptomyces rishiriensis TaxID=68264 RepID=UPI00131ED532|nr:DUF6421 family protein [Streptomyces rishiriensis]